MALSKKVTVEAYGVPLVFEKAYFKIENVNGNVDNLNVMVSIYTEINGELIGNESYSFKPDVSDDSQNFIKQSYDFLKTLPEFENAINW